MTEPRPDLDPDLDPDLEPTAPGPGGPGVIESLPGLVRIAAGAWLRSAAWGLDTSVRVGARVARAARSPGEAADLVHDFGTGVRGYARELLGVSDLDERVRQLMPASAANARARAPRHPPESGRDSLSLREQGGELLRESADVNAEEDAHPAYAGVLSALAPDEGRILRLIAQQGSQPALNVRAANLVGMGSRLVAPGLNMIGAEAGCRHVDRIPAYLNNLERLGLISFSPEPIDDPMRYQVLEAQPDVLAAIKRAGRAKTIQRSIRLTPFGRDFCEVCLPLQTASIEALGESGGGER